MVDSNFVSESGNVQQSSHVYAGHMVRTNSRYVFGGGYFGECEFVVRFMGGYNAKRCLECSLIADSSDLYYSFNCLGCHDLLFSFNLRNKRNCVGNLELPKDRYTSLKKKLIGEMASNLKKSKCLPSIFDLAQKKKADTRIKLDIRPDKDETDFKVIEKAFASTFKVLLKKDPGSIIDYEDWLSRHKVKIDEAISPFGFKFSMPEPLRAMPFSKMIPRERSVSRKEALELGKLSLKEEDITSFDRIIERMPEISYYTPELYDGINSNVINTPITYNATNVYKIYDATYSDRIGLCTMGLNSKSAFGCFRVIETQFSINCYNSFNLNRCFEMDTSTKCADSYFCHNSEGLAEAMFCFNAKGKRYAIGNTELPPEKYRKIKGSLLEEIADELVKNKELKLDIFNLGCYRK